MPIDRDALTREQEQALRLWETVAHKMRTHIMGDRLRLEVWERLARVPFWKRLFVPLEVLVDEIVEDAQQEVFKQVEAQAEADSYLRH